MAEKQARRTCHSQILEEPCEDLFYQMIRRLVARDELSHIEKY